MAKDKKNGSTAVAPAERKELAVVNPEAARLFLDETQGTPREVPTQLPQVRIMHDDAQWCLPSGELVYEIAGYPIMYFMTRQWYRQAFKPGGKGQPPDCFSGDCVTPDARSGDKQAEECATCPQSQWESGRDGRGQACATHLWVFLYDPESDNIMFFRAPPSSLSALKGTRFKTGYFGQASARSGGAYEIVWSTFGLTKVDGAKHSVVTPKMGPTAGVETVRKIVDARKRFLAAMREMRGLSPEAVDDEQ